MSIGPGLFLDQFSQLAVEHGVPVTWTALVTRSDKPGAALRTVERAAALPGEVYPLDVEIWPTSLVFPKGWRLALTLQGHDFVVAAPGRMLHNDPRDRPEAEFGGDNTLHTGGEHESYLLMPVILAR